MCASVPAPGGGRQPASKPASQSATTSHRRRAAACLAGDDEQEEKGTQDSRHERKGKGARRTESRFVHICGCG